jgi:multimeric flavodoxin WrbA
MKVLGIAGSPRRDGNTDRLLAEVLRGAADCGAEVEMIVANDLSILPCQHCDTCFEVGQCKYGDDMQIVYHKLENADRVVLASPLHFMGITAQAKALIDRCQALWARKYILGIPPLGNDRKRKGLFISVGGIQKEGLFEAALVTARTFFATLDVEYAGELLFAGIDDTDAILEHPDALQQAYEAGCKLVTG